MTIVAPLNVSSLLGEDASELYAKNQYNLLVLMMKDNVITIDWNDEILAKTVLTHDGKRMNDAAKPQPHPGGEPPAKTAKTAKTAQVA